MLALALFVSVAPSAGARTVHRDGPFTCAIPILNPDMDRSSTKTYAQKTALNGQSDLDVGGTLRRDFSLAATFTLPRATANRGLFYSNWLLLIPVRSSAFVQLELMRWKKYRYRDEIALTWTLPHGQLVYRDTGIFLNDGPHQLSIGVRRSTIAFGVDGRTICSAPERAFFSAADHLYYQIGTEVAQIGDRPVGTVSNIRLKQDGASEPAQVAIQCIYRGYGTSWERGGSGVFTAAGVFDTTQPYLKFTGLKWNEPCVF